jgi:hypothetical protein
VNCETCREHLAAYLEELVDQPTRSQIDSHLAECPACRAELEELRQLAARLARCGKANGPVFAEAKTGAVPTVSLENAVIDRILRQQALEIRRLTMRRRIRILGISGMTAAAIAAAIVSSYWFAEPAQAQKAAEAMARAAEAVPNPTTVHIVAKLRTIPHDNFSLIGDKFDFVPVEVWRLFGQQPKWRVEKPGRVAVMDGQSTVMLIRPNYGCKLPHPTEGAFDSGWLLGLANVQDMITRELRTALAKGWDLKTTNETTADGANKIVVTVEAKAGVPDNDYAKNKWFEISDMRRVYRFDAKTQRLEGFEAYLHRPQGDVQIMAIEKIEYGQPIKPEVFTLEVPNSVVWYKEPAVLPDNAKYEKMTPEETARAFFEACEKQDWNEVEKLYGSLDERIKEHLAMMKLVSLGKPFQSKQYPGWFVPYEVKLTMKHHFAVSYNNPAKRCIVFLWGKRPTAKQLAEVKPLPDNEKYQKINPKEAVEAVFKAFEKQDVDEAWRLLGGLVSKEEIKQQMSGPQISGDTVGEPVAGEEAGDWKVPVQIRAVKKHNIALRKDNPAKRYVVDGGI